MDNDNEANKAFLVGMGLGAILTMFLVIVPFMRPAFEVTDLKQQAVEHGYAEWRVTHAHDGRTEFRWLDKPLTTDK